jgi:hypothetical protein
VSSNPCYGQRPPLFFNLLRLTLGSRRSAPPLPRPSQPCQVFSAQSAWVPLVCLSG